MTKKPAPPTAQSRPFFKCFPSNFLQGCVMLSAEEKGVYYSLLMGMYDTWQSVDDSTVERRQYLARVCGTSTRGFTAIVVKLLAKGKLFRDAQNRLSNTRFERERSSLGEFKSDLSTEKKEDKSKIKAPLNGPATNDPKGLGGLPYARESRLQTLDSTVPGNEQALSDDAEEVLESEIQQICRAIGVDLRQSTKRAGWPLHWSRMSVENDLLVGDMVAAIDSYSHQFKGDQVRSLGMFKARAIEKRVARQLSDRLAGRAHARAKDVPAPELSEIEWFNHLKLFLSLGTWPPTLGPAPVQPGCHAPAELLDKAEVKWIEQGNHPEAMHHGGARVAWRADKPHQGVIHEPTPFAPRSRPA